ncbi:MAG: alpha/beta-hydrolase family protein, partial [Acidimicrobiia bacterium]
FIDWANDTFGAADNGTPAGITQPTTATQSGGPGSLTPWKTLGAEGRNFAGGAPTQAQIQSYVGPTRPAKAPVRVYVGIDSAPTPETRAELAVKELERTGGFDRAVLCVATVTGTGWVDPAAARALEYMWAGDTAIVAQQYSFFPSWISFLVDAQKSEAAGRALNDAIYKKWASLPETKRPKLIVFGLSLGSFGAEAAFVGPNANASVDALTSRTNGTYLVGPTNTNEIWNQLQDTRLKGSPAWRPRDASEHVWFANSPNEQNKPGNWPNPRVLYSMHASDPVAWWNWRTIWSSPPWVDHPTGPDVPSTVRWTPIVTWIQTIGDLINGFSTDPGHGHNYTDAYAQGWAAVVPPPNWTAADSARLNQFIVSGGSDANSGNS